MLIQSKLNAQQVRYAQSHLNLNYPVNKDALAAMESQHQQMVEQSDEYQVLGGRKTMAQWQEFQKLLAN